MIAERKERVKVQAALPAPSLFLFAQWEYGKALTGVAFGVL
jgi:hypothetical protein